MFECFKKKAPKIIISPEQNENIDFDKETRRICLVIGHNKKGSGAENYLGESEFYYNRRITRKLLERMNDIEPNNFYMIAERPAVKSYTKQVRSIVKECMKNKIKEAYCFHFNDSDNRKSNGLEILHTKLLSDKSKKRALLIAKEISIASNSRLRADNGLLEISRRHAGYGMINSLESNFIDTILLEPCFAKDRKAGKFFFENEQLYVNSLAEGILYNG